MRLIAPICGINLHHQCQIPYRSNRKKKALSPYSNTQFIGFQSYIINRKIFSYLLRIFKKSVFLQPQNLGDNNKKNKTIEQ